MGFYNVVRPCVVGKLHYATVPAQPIEVDDDVAAPLVESGDLTPYGTFKASELKGSILGQVLADIPEGEDVFIAPHPPYPGMDTSVNPVPVTIVDDEPEKPAIRTRAQRRPKA